MKWKMMGLFVGLLIVSTGSNSAAAARFLISSTPFGGASSNDSPAPSAPAGVGVYFGLSTTDNGTCLGCDFNVGLGTFSNFTQSFTAQNSPNFANFVSQATAGSAVPGHFVWAVLWTTNTVLASIPIGAPVFQNNNAVLPSLPSAPVINEVELVIDNYCSGPACTLSGSPETFSNFLIGSLNLYAATPVPEPSTFALLGVGLLALGFARRRKRA